MEMHFIKGPTGKCILQPFILCPNYQDITLVKAQIRWCDKTAEYFLDKYLYETHENEDHFLYNEYKGLAQDLRDKLKEIAR
jgi:hypothetical protein